MSLFAISMKRVDTAITTADLKNQPELQAVIQPISPVRRIAVPEEVGDVIVFLSSASGSYINGQGLLVDAGLCLTMNRT